MPATSYGQETGGKKLEVSEKNSPSKMDNKKIRTSKRRRAKGNPNKGTNKVIVINPFKWDWDKVMWFKARKSDYETYDYNPDKRPKRKTYDNKPNYKSADREAITNPSELQTPLIPYDSRIADKGPVLLKKSNPKKGEGSKVGGKKLFSERKDKDRKAFDNDKLETASKPDLEPKMSDSKIMFNKQKDDYAKMNNDKLRISERPDYKSNKTDGDKLLIIDAADKKPNPYNNDKLLISEPANRERKPYDDDKLMTINIKDKNIKPYDDDKLMNARPANYVRKPFDKDKLMIAQPANRERKPYDNSKLMTATPANPERKPFDNSKLMTSTIFKPSKQDLHDDRLLTVLEKKNPTDEMKQNSKDISNLEGDYKRHFYISSESHPGTKILAAENTKVPFLARTFQSVASFFTNIWTDNTQPNYVTRKKPKEKRDKNEGQIWDNSVHPNEWKKEKAESGEQ